MSSTPQVSPDEIVLQYSSWQVITAMDVASAVLLIYDYSLTFEREVRLVWPARMTLGKALYFLTRYLVLIDTFVAVAISYATIRDFRSCSILYTIVCWLEVIGIAIAEAILILRTWALWGRNRKLLIVIGTLYIAIEIATGVFIQIFLNSIQWLIIDGLPGCNVITANPILFGAYALLMLFETIVLILTIMQAVRYSRRYPSSLLQTVYRDGILFYLYLSVVSVINVVVLVAAPSAFGNVLAVFQRVLHAILSSRIILNMRDVASKDVVLNGSALSRSTAGSIPMSSFSAEGEAPNGREQEPPLDDGPPDDYADDLSAWFGNTRHRRRSLSRFGLEFNTE